jgi:hypothetical protein
MLQPAHPGERSRTRVLIPLDAEAAMRALMDFDHSHEKEIEPPAARERGGRD